MERVKELSCDLEATVVLSHADSSVAGPASSPAPPALALQQGGMEARPARSRQAVSAPSHPGSSLTSWFQVPQPLSLFP